MTPLRVSIAAAAAAAILLLVILEVIIVAVVICGGIFELLRRKRLMERYALLWFATGITLLVLALWKGLLTKLSHAAGIHYLPSALFAVGFLFVLALLVHSSTTISRLTDQSTILAQRLALLQQRLDQQEGGSPESLPSAAAGEAPDAQGSATG